MNFRKLLLTNIGTTNSVITDTTDRYGPIITVGGVGVVGGDFSHTGMWPSSLSYGCASVHGCASAKGLGV